MKLLTVQTPTGLQSGILTPNGMLPFSQLGLPPSMLELIQGGPDLWNRAREAFPESHETQSGINLVKAFAPLPNPGKILGIGLNYMDHCREQKVKPPSRPLVFAKFNTALIGPGMPITWDPRETQQVDYEVELAVIIGRTARRVPVEQALETVFGYTILNDVSARDMQFSDKQWVRAKSLDSFCPMGPVIVTADEIPDPQNLRLRCTVNGQVLQDSTTAEMIFGVRELIADLSRWFTLEPGDIIATGTPDGVGVFRDPQVFLKDGDLVECEIEKIGKLESPVVAPGQ